MENYKEEHELAEKALNHLISAKDFDERYRGLTGKRYIDSFYPKAAVAIFSDLIICLQNIYKNEKVSLRILFQELFKIADLMEKKNLSGHVVWNEIVDLERATIFSEYISEKAIDDTFNYIIAALYINEISGFVMENCAFHSKIAYKFENYDYSNESRTAWFEKPTEFIDPIGAFSEQIDNELKERIYPLGIPESKIRAFNIEMDKQGKRPELINYIEWEYGTEVLSQIFKK